MRKQCKRKIWRTDINPVQHAIDGARITPQELLDQIHMRELSSLEAMTHGKGDLQAWHDLSAAVRLCVGMADAGGGAEALDACNTARSELDAAAVRYETTGRMGLTGRGIEAVRDVLEYHQLQRQSVSRSTYERVIAATVARIRA